MIYMMIYMMSFLVIAEVLKCFQISNFSTSGVAGKLFGWYSQAWMDQLKEAVYCPLASLLLGISEGIPTPKGMALLACKACDWKTNIGGFLKWRYPKIVGW